MQGRYLLRPSASLNDIILGVLGRAQRLRPVEVCAVSVLSNHLHLLLVADDAQQVARFMQYVGSNLAREVNRLTGWSGSVFHSRYSMIVVSDEEEAQVGRLRYVLSQSCKENLVERLRDWPGVSSVRTLVDGEPLTGHWIDRTLERIARARRGSLDITELATIERLVLSPIPRRRHLSPEMHQRATAELVDAIEQEAAAERKRTGIRALGVRAILAQHPQHRPETIAKSPAPLIHAASRAVRRAFYEAYARFVAAFRAAAETLRRGDSGSIFPAGSFPPALPFVPG